MRAMPRRALTAAVPAAVLLFALTACGGGSDSGDSAASDTQAAAPAEGGAANEAAEGGDAVEKPLTGEAKQKAEAAALAAHPGTVIKSEEDAENPGMYAVEVKKADGSEVEVYLDPATFKVVKTKEEGTEEAGEAAEAGS
ncbi:PepSY domain-containing protein [Streptomyces sp. NPDC050287]|uniref:PepSY domain-containing protein n=1 Tax=Streptomyces sp. NPDC050287 TaxID=3365608 RepID=UPI0037A852F5